MTGVSMSRSWQGFWLGAASLACVVVAPAAGVVAIMSPIAIDRQGSLLNPFAWLAFILMVTLWIVCLLAPFAAWVSFKRNKTQMAWTIISAPPIWAAVMALCLISLPG
jgi:hypothetical protein